MWIKKYLLNNFCWRRKVCRYIIFFIVPSVAPMHRLTELLFFTVALYTMFFVGSFLVGAMGLFTYSCIVCWDACCCGGFQFFCNDLLWFWKYYLYYLFMFKILARGKWLGKYLPIRFRKSLPMFDVMHHSKEAYIYIYIYIYKQMYYCSIIQQMSGCNITQYKQKFETVRCKNGNSCWCDANYYHALVFVSPSGERVYATS